MNTYRPATEVTRTGIVIGGAYLPRLRPEQAHAGSGPHRHKRDIDRTVMRWVIAILTAAVVIIAFTR